MSKKQFTMEEAEKVGEKLGLKWKEFNLKQFWMGINVELEHGTRDSYTNVSNDDPIITGKIALAHLNELPDYYTRLKEMEKEGEAVLENKKGCCCCHSD